jgi:hypothetical protein
MSERVSKRISIWAEAEALALAAIDPVVRDRDPMALWLLTEAIVELAFRYRAMETRPVGQRHVFNRRGT